VARERPRQPDRPDYGSAMEPKGPVCGEPVVVELDEAIGATTYRCPNGHTDDPLVEAEAAARPRVQVGELGEDA
jgi:hypothetical protein